MKENNWEQVKDIFQAAIECPEAEREQFLREACGDDRNLSDEVRGLLDSFNEDDSFLDGPAIGEVADIIADEKGKLQAGVVLGRYQIDSLLGAGGMGEVFLAEDLELERPVALKILSSVFSNDAERVRRFTREAKSVSALNHPNILTIYEIGQFNELRFIATEYIRGETLRQRQARKNLSAGEIIEILTQAAVALGAAHRAKIIHRDVKPENIMIREDGLVKVLDFGLAKPFENSGEPARFKTARATQFNTTPGILLGTAAYMSPEQARGNPTDARTDIWSLGICLYEMIAGRQPFTGQTTSDTIASILKSEPEPLNVQIPGELKAILEKALQKKCENRYQTIDELLAALKSFRRSLDAETGRWEINAQTADNLRLTAVTDNAPIEHLTEPESSSPTRRTGIGYRASSTKPYLLAVIGGLLLAAAVFGLYTGIKTWQATPSFQTMRFNKLTYSGNVSGEQIAVSPDGKYTVYTIQETAGQSLWINQAASRSNMQIVAPAEVEYGGMTFSRDGNYVYYSMLEKKDSTALYRIPVLGGEPQKILDNVERPVTFSPDGQRMAFVRNERFIMTADAGDGRHEQLLATAAEGKRWNFISWSPDGETIAATVFSSADNQTTLSAINAGDGTEKPIKSPPWLRISGINWLPDESGIIIGGRDFETKLSQIWMMTYPGGQLSKITNDLNSYMGSSLSADGQTIAAIQYERLSNIWTSSETDFNLTRQVTFDKNRDEGISGVAWTPDGKFVYTAGTAGTQDLWISDAQGVNKTQLTINAKSNFSPAVSPDNRFVAFVSNRSGSTQIWRMDINGDNPRQLTGGPGIFSLPAFSPDGQWIIYQFTNPANEPTVWKIGIDGGAPVQLTDVYSAKPVISPNGELFACLYRPAGSSQLKIAEFSLADKKAVKIFDWPQVVKSPIFRWSADGNSLIYVDNQNGAGNLWSQPLDNTPPKQLTNFKSEQIFRFDVMNDGKSFALARGHESSDVITINDFR